MSWIKPIIFENSRLPVWFSKVSPINIWAFSFGPFIVCRGKLSEATRIHETIHFHQQLEMLFVFQWALYAIFYVVGRVTHKSWKLSYYNNPFELEAYDNQIDPNYLANRKFYAWTQYIKGLKP